jgi:hypothetical protein
MASIAAGIGRIKDHLERWITVELVERAGRSAGHRWRERVLDPVIRRGGLVLQVLHGNERGRQAEGVHPVDLVGDRSGGAVAEGDLAGIGVDGVEQAIGFGGGRVVAGSAAGRGTGA